MKAKQRAQWFLGIHPEQIKKNTSAPFTTAADAIAACNEIIKDFGEHYPPHLVGPYWREVKEQIILLNNK